MRASRVLLAAIRPATRVPPPLPSKPVRKQAPRGLGVLFLLGGLALASWIVKPAKRPLPEAAMEPMKRKISIVSVLGDSKGAAQEFAARNGFVYVKLGADPGAQLQPLVAKGATHFILEGLPAPSKLESFENNVVMSDLVLDFRGRPETAPADPELAFLERARRLAPADRPIYDILNDRNLL